MAAATIPSRQQAVIGSQDHGFEYTPDYPVIEPEDYSILIKVEAVGLNPVDTKLVGDFVTPGVIFGMDMAGTVVKVGKDTVNPPAVGDRVCGCANGMDKHRPLGGAFCEYATLHKDLWIRMPEDLTFENAAALGLAMQTAAMALFWTLKIPQEYLLNPAPKPFPVLVYGGSSATGTMTIQFLKLAGLQPITTCSPHNFDLVKSYGAEAVFDYNSPTCAEDIRAYTNNHLQYAVDCITSESTIKICYAAIGRAGGKYVAMDPHPDMSKVRRAVKPDWVLVTRIAGQPCAWPPPFESFADPKYLEWSSSFFKILQKLITEDKIKPHPIIVNNDGLKGILDGVGKLRNKEISGKKLVYKVGA